MRGVTAANHGKSFNSGSLLADLVPSTEPREAAAQLRKRRNRRGKPPARRTIAQKQLSVTAEGGM